ncbi:DNA-binding protein [Pseudonocardia sulfidoxydans NBRC 16205]|uniref:DNA-binding protein n=1 Tax=Pseudonocardia sulfidoxydans NBRC 16205 TaxID=1223511 RepID=A0A511DGU8_9PSEU|nr:helix-turn-helix transcriptional regulator [Pseudonocardia sulfidoxydans]GEL23747.1 DNA-binding protein [Pseudonocardia sulfidoxydans NBRC 16205]
MSNEWSSSAELGTFLRSRRAALTPDAADVVSHGQRRVPGLRREEVAQLAGISTTYYTRLEQGESHQISDSVLDALARVLDLGPDERAHLVRLAAPGRAARRPGDDQERLRPAIQALVDGATGQAAIIVGRRTDLLGANRLGYALWGLPRPDPHSEQRAPNVSRFVFLSPAARDLFPDWESQARSLSSYLRVAAADYPDDPVLHGLIGELSVRSHDFARIWADYPVGDCVHSVREYRHRTAGTMVLNEEIVRLPDDPGIRIIFSGAEDGTPSADRLRSLADGG